MNGMRLAPFVALLVCAPACGSTGAPDGSPATVSPASTAMPATAAAAGAAPGTGGAPGVKAIPDGLNGLIPHIVVSDVAAAATLYADLFEARIGYTMAAMDGKAVHAELHIGDSLVMVGLEDLKRGPRSPKTLGGTSTSIMVYVKDADAVLNRALAAGSKVTMPLGTMFWGDRFGEFVDPFGHKWAVATHVSDVPDAAIPERARAFAEAMAAGTRPPEYTGDPDAASYLPKGFRNVTPGLVVDGASEAIEFYKGAFGAEEVSRMSTPDGKKIMHAELRIGDGIFFVSDADPEHGAPGPKDLKGTSMTILRYVTDADAAYARAIGTGARDRMPMADMIWGDRYGVVRGKFGHMWGLATQVEDLTPEQIGERLRAGMEKAAPAGTP